MFHPRHKVSARIERWTRRFQPFMLAIKHIPGKGNHTDILSRMPLQKLIDKSRLRTEEYINQIIRYSVPEAIKLEEIQELSEDDPELVVIREAILEGKWDQKGLPQAYKRVKDEFTVANGIVETV